MAAGQELLPGSRDEPGHYYNPQSYSCTGATLDANGSFNTSQIPCGSSAALQLNIGPETLAPTNYYVTVWASATIGGQSVEHVQSYWLALATSQASGIAATPYTQSVALGATSPPFTIGLVTANSFDGSVNLSATVAGPSCGGSAPCPSVALGSSTLYVNPSGGLLSTTMTASTSANTPTGVYTIVVTGQSTGEQNASTSVKLTVGAAPAPGFTLTATPPSVLASPGGAVQYSVMAAPINGFSGQVTFSYSCLLGGTAVGFVPGSLSVSGTATATATVVVPAGAAAGASSCTVTGTSAGSQSQGVSLSFIVAGSAPVITGSLPTGVVGLAYTASLTASGAPRATPGRCPKELPCRPGCFSPPAHSLVPPPPLVRRHLP